MNLPGDIRANGSSHSPAPVALPQGLRALADEWPSKRLARRMRRLSDLLAAGKSWEAALADPTVRLPEHVRGLIQAGLHSSRLAESLERLVDIQRRGDQVRREIWMSLAYPLTLLFLLMAMVICYEAGFVGQFVEIYRDFELQLPLVTQLVISWGNPTSITAMIIATVALAVCIVLQAAVQPLWLALCFNQLPLLGSLWRWAALVEFARLLGLLVEAGLPLPEALRMTAAGLRNGPLRSAAGDLAKGVEQGQTLSAAMQQHHSIPETMTAVVQWGETRSSLPEGLRSAADMFAGRVQIQMVFVRTFLPPFTFIIVAGVIAVTIIATFVPLISVLETLV